MAAGRHSLGTIVGWIEVTREAEEAEEVTRGLELADEQLVIVGQEAANEMPTSRRVNFNIDLQPSSIFEQPYEMYIVHLSELVLTRGFTAVAKPYCVEIDQKICFVSSPI